MSDAALAATAFVAVVVAYLAPPVPMAAVLAGTVVAVGFRRPVPVAVALVLLVAGRSHASVEALDAALPERIHGTAELVSDPERRAFDTSVEVRLGGRRWQARVGRTGEWVLRPLLTGDRVVLTGRVRPLVGAPEGWRRSRHLAGAIGVSAIGPGPRAPPWYRAANGVHRLVAAGSATFPDRTRALYLGLVLGDDRGQSELDRFRFQATGLGHLLAVSGQNVVFLLAVFRPLLSRIGVRSRWMLGLAVLAGFVLVTRAEASVLRAAAMAGIALVAAASGRVVTGVRVLSLAVIGLVAVDPLLASGLGFQLSVCATVGLLIGVGRIGSRLGGPRWLREVLAATVAAQIATAPLLIGRNGGIPAVATITNVLAVPAAGLVMMLGLTTGLLAGMVVEPVAVWITAPNRLLTGWIDLVARTGSRLPVPLIGPDRLVPMAVAAAILGVGRVRRRWRVLAAALLLVPTLAPPSTPSGVTPVTRGAELLVDGCERRTVVLSGRVDVSDVLDGLHQRGVTRAELVVGNTASSTIAVAEQLGAVVRSPPRNGPDETAAAPGCARVPRS